MTWSKHLRRTPAVREAQRAEGTTLVAPLESPTQTLHVPAPAHGLRIAVLPDAQVRKGVDTRHLRAYGRFIAAKRPDVIVCIGDFGDFPSLSAWNKPGSIEAEGLRYSEDVAATRAGMEEFLDPIRAASQYNPRMIFTLGNHEDRIARAVQVDPNRLHGVIGIEDLRLSTDYGWQVFPFLQPVVIGGVAFCHYFPNGIMGRPVSTARALLQKMHMSCYAGHLQGKDIAFAKRADGGHMAAIISGSFYTHDEEYLSPFTNNHWRGAWFLHEVRGGQFDEMSVSINYLLRKFA